MYSFFSFVRDILAHEAQPSVDPKVVELLSERKQN